MKELVKGEVGEDQRSEKPRSGAAAGAKLEVAAGAGRVKIIAL